MRQLFIFLLCTLAYSPLSAQSVELSWEDLVTASEQKIIDTWLARQEQLGENDELEPLPELGKVRTDLNGQQIKIAGFVIPLESDEQTITELLLVPYFGACYHVPPPPENQIIYVKFAEGIAIKELWDVVYVIGELQAQDSSHDMADVGYSLRGTGIEEYRE